MKSKMISGGHILVRGHRMRWVALLFVAASAVAVDAEEVYMEHERHGAWEATFHLDYLGGADYDGILNSELRADSDVGWGATMGYNISNQWLVGLEFLSARQDYEATITDDGETFTQAHELDVSTTHFFATYHFTPERFTPFVTLAAGWANIDSNVASRREQGNCWWDSWYGYTCSTYYPTYNDTSFSLRASAGVRWDFHDQLFTRASVGRIWVEPGSSDAPTPALVRIEIGYRR